MVCICLKIIKLQTRKKKLKIIFEFKTLQPSDFTTFDFTTLKTYLKGCLCCQVTFGSIRLKIFSIYRLTILLR